MENFENMGLPSYMASPLGLENGNGSMHDELMGGYGAG